MTIYMTYGKHPQRPAREIAVLVLRLHAAKRKTYVQINEAHGSEGG
jgi:hypothetical protein